MNRITFENPPTKVEIFKAIQCIPHGKRRGKLLVSFRAQMQLIRRGRHTPHLDEAEIRLFESRRGVLCYTFASKTGHPLSAALVKSIAWKSEEELDAERREKAAKLLKRVHPNAWQGMVEEGPDKAKHLGLTPRSITSIFTDAQLQIIRDGFENQEPFRIRVPATSQNGRDYTAEGIVPDADSPYGDYQVFFSSEYPQCGNGRYYLLINPMTATFWEDD